MIPPTSREELAEQYNLARGGLNAAIHADLESGKGARDAGGLVVIAIREVGYLLALELRDLTERFESLELAIRELVDLGKTQQPDVRHRPTGGGAGPER